MLFKLNINITEDDYLSFNNFHSLESVYGKKMVRKTRFFFILAMVLFAAIFALSMGLTTETVITVGLLLLFTLFYMLFFKKMLTRNMKTYIKRLKKTGKLPFDYESTFEFYEDKMIEITATKRTEQSYQALERICVVKDSYILLYNSSVGAYILPIGQVKTQLNHEEFVGFLTNKCANVEYY